MAAGRYKTGKKKGQIKPGYRLTKGGRVVKVSKPRRRKNPRKKSRRRKSTRKTTRKRTTSRRRTVARKRTRRRRYRRNQPKVIQRLVDGTVSAAQVLAGKAVVRTVPEMVGGVLPQGPGVKLAVEAGIAVVAGMLAQNMFGKQAGEMITAGALSAPLESLVVAANVPVLSPALSAYPMPNLSAYVQSNNRLLSAYPEVTLEDYDYAADAAYGEY